MRTLYPTTAQTRHTYLDNPEVAEVKHAVDVVGSLAKQEGLSPSHISQLMVLVVKREGGGKTSEWHTDKHAKITSQNRLILIQVTLPFATRLSAASYPPPPFQSVLFSWP